MRTKLFSGLAIALLLGACSAVVPKLQTPRLQVVGVEVLRSDLLQQQLRVRMHVQNPNDRALPVRGITYTLEVAGEDFARGESDRNFTVPALGEMEFDVSVTANAAGTLLRLATRPGGMGDNLEYRLRGKLSLSAGLLRSIPFDQRGSLKLR
ncbi:MAG: LEA type 2 family protein [Steroidobacteraceae bacterium]